MVRNIGTSMTAEWTDDDQLAAFREGWGIFDCDGSDNGPWQICKLDDPANLPELGYDEPKFAEDNVAWIHVRTQAANNSPLHRKALCFVYQHNRQEYDAIMAWEGA